MFKNKKIIILHSKDDEVVPYKESKINYKTAKNLFLNVIFIEITGNHNKFIFPDNILS